MKNFLIAIAFTFFAVPLIHAQNASAYAIEGRIAGIKDTMVLLGYHYGDKQYLKDTALVDGTGRFKFEGEEHLDGGIYLVVMPEKNYFEIIVADNQKFSFETRKDDLIGAMKIKDSPENQLFFDYLKYINPKGAVMDSLRRLHDSVSTTNTVLAEALKTQMQAVDKEVQDYKDRVITEHPQTFVGKMFRAMKEPEIPLAPVGVLDTNAFRYHYFREHYFDNIDFSDDRILRTPVFHNKVRMYIEQVTPQIPDTVIKAADKLADLAKDNKELFKYSVWFITNSAQNSKVMGMDEVFYHMTRKYYETGRAYWADSTTVAKMKERADKIEHNIIGKMARDIVGRDTSGNPVSLYGIKAPFTVIYFWDSDCGHCKKTTPVVLEEYHKWKDKGVKFLAVNVEQETEDWKAYVKENNLDWINLIDVEHRSYFRFFYDIYSTPVIYILDEHKNILVKRIGAEQISEVLEMEFEKLMQKAE